MSSLKSPLPSEIFRAYDIRGTVGRNLQVEAVPFLGYALGQMAKATNPTVLVGRDGRLSSPALFKALTEGLLSAGCRVLDLGIVTSPMLYFATHHLSLPHGVMITGSHNPKEDNGFKIILEGDSLHTERLQILKQKIESLLKDQPLFLSGSSSTGSSSTENLQQYAILNDYVQAITSRIQLRKPCRIVIDAGNAAASVVAETLFQQLGCEVIPLFCELDGHFPHHHPDPGQPKNLEVLQKTVILHQADLGFAFDGDGDRLGVVDNQGRILWPDRLLMLFAQDVLQRHPNTAVIFDVKCSQHLSKFITQHQGLPILWKTGHSLIKAKMKETGAQLAGELSGHIFFKDRWFGFDDGLYSAARLLDILSNALDAQRVKESAELFDPLPNSLCTPEMQIPVQESEKFQIMDALIQRKQAFGGEPTLIDGLRIDFDNGFGLIRASNTSSNLILRFEASTGDVLEKIQACFREQLNHIDSHLSF